MSTPMLVYTASGAASSFMSGVPYFLSSSILLLALVIAMTAIRSYR